MTKTILEKVDRRVTMNGSRKVDMRIRRSTSSGESDQSMRVNFKRLALKYYTEFERNATSRFSVVVEAASVGKISWGSGIPKRDFLYFNLTTQTIRFIRFEFHLFLSSIGFVRRGILHSAPSLVIGSPSLARLKISVHIAQITGGTSASTSSAPTTSNSSVIVDADAEAETEECDLLDGNELGKRGGSGANGRDEKEQKPAAPAPPAVNVWQVRSSRMADAAKIKRPPQQQQAEVINNASASANANEGENDDDPFVVK
ncbi:hypothetical protein BT96DRAFT_951549, partial [Gymnopus androsaceus JB14]